MQYDNILDALKTRLGIEELDVTEKDLRAVLQTLGERFKKDDREKLASQLPEELKESVFEKHSHETARQDYESISLDNFYIRCANRMDLGRDKAEARTNIIVDFLKDTGLEGVFKGALKNLPEEYKKLLGEK